MTEPMTNRPTLRSGLEIIADGEGDAVVIAQQTLDANPLDDSARAAEALIEWCRRVAARAGGGHIDENERFVVKALLGEFDRANALEAFPDLIGAGELAAETMRFLYRNYRGEVSIREVRTPIVTYLGETQYHAGQQWLVRAFDIEKEAYRDFALRDMRFFHQLFDGAEG